MNIPGRKSGSGEFTACSKTSRPRGYIEHYNPHAKTRELLAQAQAVLDEYRQYWPLTCRQIFYRLVGAHGYDKTEAAYGRLCHHLANARRARLIQFDAIRDDGVQTEYNSEWHDKDHFLRHLRHLGSTYKRDKLVNQEYHIEVWSEAAGMLPQLSKAAAPYSINAYSSGGFDSLTAKKALADRICWIEKPAIILHLGDYDPSGESIFDVVAEDVAAFVEADRPHGLITVKFERVALTETQVRIYDLPTAPPKASDSRSKGWKKGGTCQLEALPPDIIAQILREAIERHIDFVQYGIDEASEEREREEVSRLLLAPPRD